VDADAVSVWLATHLSWFVWALLAIWAPPLLFTIAIDLGLIAAPGSGYPALTDPALLTSCLQIALMAAALPGLSARRPRSWMFLAAALGAWCAHASWLIQGRVRLTGVRTLLSPETLLSIAGIAAAASVLLAVRRVAPGRPAHVP
jgi:hypothetical protein